MSRVPQPACQTQPNLWTLYDLHGNVWEWTANWFFDHAESGRMDGARAESRVLRGGSFNYDNGFRAARAGSPR